MVLYYRLCRSWGKNNYTSIALFSYLDALLQIKSQYFAGEQSEGLEPKCGTVSVADRTVKGVGHIIAASVWHGGPGPGFLAQ